MERWILLRRCQRGESSTVPYFPVPEVPVYDRRLAVGFVVGLLALPALVRGQAAYDSTVFTGLTWREIGIFRGGRTVAVAGSATRPREYWMGTTGGGVFKSTDGGNTWAAAADKYFGGTIGAFGVSASNPNIVYVGSGEFP